jgi:exosortase
MALLATKPQWQIIWQRALPFLIISIVVFIYFPTFIELSSQWVQWDESLSHAYPLLFWFLILVYRLGPIDVAPQRLWVDILLALGLVFTSISWFLFHLIQIRILEQLVLLPILYCAIAFIFGVKKLWQLRFLLLMPLFVLPIWDYLNNGLVQLASSIVGEMVRAVRIPALIDGSSIFIPSGHIMIADGCSGLRYLIISLALGYTISYLNGYKEKGLLISLFIAALLGLVANWIRIFILILVGYHTEMASSLMEDHETFGWIVFALICFPAIYFAPVIKVRSSIALPSAANNTPVLGKLILLFLLLLPGVILTRVVAATDNGEQAEYHLTDKDFMQALSLPLPLSLPVAAQTQQFISPAKIYLQINQYHPKSSQDRLVPYIPRQFDIQFWVQEQQRVVSVGERKVRVEQFRQKSGLKRVVQVQWFDVGGFSAATVPQAKLLQIPAVLSGNHYFSIFTLQAECVQNDCESAQKSLFELSETIQ